MNNIAVLLKINRSTSSRTVVFHTAAHADCLFLLGMFMFDHWTDFTALWQIRDMRILTYGIGGALLVIIVDAIVMKVFPAHMYDDGGLNEKCSKPQHSAYCLVNAAHCLFRRNFISRDRSAAIWTGDCKHCVCTSSLSLLVKNTLVYPCGFY